MLGEVEDLSREAQYCYYMIYRWLAKGGENVFRMAIPASKTRKDCGNLTVPKRKIH